MLVNKKTYLIKVAAIARPSALRDPVVLRYLTKTSFAMSIKVAREVIFAVFAIILKKTISNGVITSAIINDDVILANKTLTN